MTRDGWWCVFAATGLGIAAVNTGNNLAYLLCSMVLAIILVSGALSVLTMLGVRPSAILPEEIFAGLPAVVGVVVTNRKRWLASYSLNIEVLGTGGRGT